MGGGIRSVEAAVQWLDAGARRVILGTAATPEILRELPRDRVMAALDAEDGEVVVKGWREKTGRTILDRIAELREMVGGFLVTFVEREGRLGGTDLELAHAVVAAAGPARVTIAGGVTTAEEIRALDKIGADAQVGMALYTGRLGIGDAVAAPLRSDRLDGLWPTVVTNEHGVALGLAYSNAESLKEAIETRRGVYYSRSRGKIWRKGETSGQVQELIRVDLDCDRDAIRFTVRPVRAGDPFCHTGTVTCWGESRGLPALETRIRNQFESTGANAASYTRRLMQDPALLQSKLHEEVDELLEATSTSDATHEAADVIYFAMVAAMQRGASLAEIEAELDRRSLKVTRRPGNAKNSPAPLPPTPPSEVINRS